MPQTHGWPICETTLLIPQFEKLACPDRVGSERGFVALENVAGAALIRGGPHPWVSFAIRG